MRCSPSRPARIAPRAAGRLHMTSLKRDSCGLGYLGSDEIALPTRGRDRPAVRHEIVTFRLEHPADTRVLVSPGDAIAPDAAVQETLARDCVSAEPGVQLSARDQTTFEATAGQHSENGPGRTGPCARCFGIPLLFSRFRFPVARMRRRLTGKRSTTPLVESPRCRVTCTAMAFRAPIWP